MKATAPWDVAIVGGGPVGAALAISLARGGLSVTVIEGREPMLPYDDAWDARVYAISPGSRDFLAGLGAWSLIAAERIEPISRMQVWSDDGMARIEFDALAAARDDLGCIVEAGRLQVALGEVLRNEPNVMLCCPSRCHALALTEKGVQLSLDGGEVIEATLVVGADGPDSWVRHAAGLAATTKPYGQTALVANFAVERSHEQIARQWFRDDGVIAWLPLPGNRISIVWSAESPVAEELLALEANAFSARVAEAGNRVLGELKQITPSASFPLRLIDVPHAVKAGVALVGDAAHVVHPLAGQGVNLGLRDAKMLERVLLGRGKHESLGDLGVLRRYERARREDWLATKWVTDGLHALFHPKHTSLAGLRSAGLSISNGLPALKRRFMEHALR